jgi:hypothetical protein
MDNARYAGVFNSSNWDNLTLVTFSTGCVEFAPSVQIKSGIKTALCSVAEPLQTAFPIKLKSVDML